jgi:hypothetical protein
LRIQTSDRAGADNCCGNHVINPNRKPEPLEVQLSFSFSPCAA